MSLRDQFKPTDVSSIKKAKDTEDAKIATGGKRTDYLDIKDGLNKFRLFPKHPNEESFYHIRGIHWLTLSDDSGGDIRRTVPNARIHAGWAKDPVEEYIKYVKDHLSTSDSDDADKIKKLTSWETGLTLQTSWICYANKMVKGSPNEFGMLEFKKTVRDALNNESIIEDEDEAITVDPFTDPDDGIPILITYNGKAKKAADYYKIQMAKSATALTDEELEKFSKLTPLSELPMFQYGQRDFEQALEGIQHFDSEFEVDLFDDEEFQSLIEDLRENLSSMPKEEKKAEPKAAATKTKSKPAAKKAVEVEEDEEDEEEDDEVEEEEDDDEGDSLDAMDRSELKKYIASESLGIKVLKSMTDDAIRDAIRELSSDEEDEVEDEEEEEDDEVDEAPAKKAPKTLEEIKAELRKKQGK